MFLELVLEYFCRKCSQQGFFNLDVLIFYSDNNILLMCDYYRHTVTNQAPGEGGALPVMAMRGGSSRKGYLFQASGT